MVGDAPSGHYQLRSCLWELTLRCNMRCLHCGSAAGKARPDELGIDECLAVIDELAALRCRELTLIGGELFLYPDWERVVRSAVAAGMLVNVMTNGWALGAEEATRLRQAGITNVGVSIDGMSTAHDTIRRRPGAFERAARALDNLTAAGVPTAVVTSIMEENVRDLEPLHGFLVSHGVGLWQLQLVNPMGNLAGRHDAVVSPSRIPELIAFIAEKARARELVVVAADSIGYFHADSEASIRGRRAAISCWEGCQAGLTGCFIDSVGDVKGCGALYHPDFVEGNVRARPLREIWNDEGRFAFNRRFDTALLAGRCQGCELGADCRGGCRASNHFNGGHLYESRYCAHALEPADG